MVCMLHQLWYKVSLAMLYIVSAAAVMYLFLKAAQQLCFCTECSICIQV